jgi:N-acetylmuramoyl-L-alanine amidase
VTLRYLNRTAKALVGSEIVLLDDQKISLQAPIRASRSFILVPSDFEPNILHALIRKKERPASVVKIKETPFVESVPSVVRREKTIVIDAGHGGKDPGAIGKIGTKEKDVVLGIAKKLKEHLEDQGLKVVMTREADVFISLNERTEIASKHKADLFVSIHANSSKSSSAHGVEVYAMGDLDGLGKKEEQRRKNHGLLFDGLSMKKNDPQLDAIIGDLLYSYKQRESHLLARDLAAQTTKLTKANNRGARSSHFFVLRNTIVPAVLIEVGFLTNSKEEKLLSDEAYQSQIVTALSQGILNYVRFN